MVPRYYQAVIYSFSLLFPSLPPAPFSLLLPRSYLIYALSFMSTRYTARYLCECNSGFTYADDGHVPYTLARRRIRAVAIVRKRRRERARAGKQGVSYVYATLRPQSAWACATRSHARASHGRDFVAGGVWEPREGERANATPFNFLNDVVGTYGLSYNAIEDAPLQKRASRLFTMFYFNSGHNRFSIWGMESDRFISSSRERGEIRAFALRWFASIFLDKRIATLPN